MYSVERTPNMCKLPWFYIRFEVSSNTCPHAMFELFSPPNKFQLNRCLHQCWVLAGPRWRVWAVLGRFGNRSGGVLPMEAPKKLKRAPNYALNLDSKLGDGKRVLLRIFVCWRCEWKHCNMCSRSLYHRPHSAPEANWGVTRRPRHHGDGSKTPC